jgi:hypothetical protein
MTGQSWAVEVERTQKSSVELRRIVQALTDTLSPYERVLYFVTSDDVERNVREAYLTVCHDAARPSSMGVGTYQPKPLDVLRFPDGDLTA